LRKEIGGLVSTKKSKKSKKQTNGCIGLCCSAFNLYGESQEDYIIEGIKGNEESKFIGDMLIFQGWDGENKDWPIYTCKYWDKESTLCTVYDKRPSMCRTYPDGEECGWEGCHYTGRDEE
jgi:Fe-S-cluster containining protein